MSTLKLDEKTARRLYPTAAPEFKEMLEESFGKSVLAQNIMERVTSVEDALAIAGKSMAQLIHPSDTKDEGAYKVIKTVIKVINDGWVADYTNKDQPKYEPRFVYKSGFGLAYYDYAYWTTRATAGSRLCYENYDKMMHGVKILEKYYNDFLN